MLMYQDSTRKEPHYRGSFFIGTKDDMADMFRFITLKYDFFNRLFSFGNDIRWRKKSAKLLQFQDNDIILDFGAGTGDFTMAISDRVRVNVVALDLVKEMLDRFRLKLNKRKSDGVIMIIGDGEYLPFSDDLFDGVIAGFVGRNLFDLEKGIREMLRVLKPGGKLGFLEFTRPLNPIVRKVVWFYFHGIIVLLGNLFMPKRIPAYSYLIESVEGFFTRNDLFSMFRTMGFKNISLFRFNLGIVSLIIGEK